MGVIRGMALVFIVVLLFVSFMLMGTFATLNSSLEHDAVSEQIRPIVRDTVENKIDPFLIDNQVSILQVHCGNNTNNTYYSFDDSEANHTFEISCDTIANGTEAIIDAEVDSLIDGTYYKEYSCEFWKCLKEENPLVLVSQYAKDYWKNKYYNFLLISIVLAGLVFLLVEKKNNFPILTGVLLVVSFIPVANLDTIGKAILKVILYSAKRGIASLGELDISSFVLIFFSKANDIFLRGFIFGLILVAIGIFLKLLKTGFKISHLFKKVESATKEEKKESK